MTSAVRPLAVVTGASSGIGLELARECASNGFDLFLAADRPLTEAVAAMRELGTQADSLQADLATREGVQALLDRLADRPVDALLANAGHGLGGAFLDQPLEEAQHVVDTNITGTLALIHAVGNRMRARGAGRILITGSIAGFMPGTFQAVYNGTKAFVDSFSFAIRHELKGSGVSVTCLMPGATETDFFERADMLDTKVGTDKKDDPAMVARQGFAAMLKGQGDVVTGWMNKLQSAIALLTPSD